ncbi:hypothetical protein AB0G98_21240 [Streptomyces sp. NPDC020196]|uniref:hypothetical protein n=1 Tax=Streptomyces sp. NPDC020196 TaxID=3156656 RepID=UPI0033FA157F
MNLTSGTRTSSGLWSSTDIVPTTLPVDLPTDTWRTILRTIVPVTAGDLLDIDARARFTNDCGYTIGVGHHLWAYDCDSGQGTAGPWWKIGPSSGDNVDPQRHHLPIHNSTVHEIPPDWPEGHRIVIALRADAHSTVWKAGNTLTVDQLGILTVRRWSAI